MTKKGKKRKRKTVPEGLVTCAIDLGIRNFGFATLAARAFHGRRQSGALRATAQERVDSFHIFIPLVLMPWMKVFWAKKKRRIMGTVMSAATAIIWPYSLPYCVRNMARPMLRV